MPIYMVGIWAIMQMEDTMEIYVVRYKESRKLVGIYNVERVEELVEILDGEVGYPSNMETQSIRNIKTYFNRNRQYHEYMGDWLSLTNLTEKFVKEFHRSIKDEVDEEST